MYTTKDTVQDLVDPFGLTVGLRVVAVERLALMPSNWQSILKK